MSSLLEAGQTWLAFRTGHWQLGPGLCSAGFALYPGEGWHLPPPQAVLGRDRTTRCTEVKAAVNAPLFPTAVGSAICLTVVEPGTDLMEHP